MRRESTVQASDLPSSSIYRIPLCDLACTTWRGGAIIVTGDPCPSVASTYTLGEFYDRKHIP